MIMTRLRLASVLVVITRWSMDLNLASVLVVVTRWSTNLNVTSILFDVRYTVMIKKI